MQQISTRRIRTHRLQRLQRGPNRDREGNILIDTPMVPSDNQKWLGLIRQVTGGKKTLYVINTDHHRGHVLGNQFYNAPVIAHDLAWKNMRGYGANFCQRVIDPFKREPRIQAELANLQIVRPTITFDTRLDIEHGGRTVRLIHVGGHTEATILIWLPEDNFLFAGDTVWCDQHPYMAQANSKQWLEALSFIRKLNPLIIVPGHGPLTTPDTTVPLSEQIATCEGRCAPAFAAAIASRKPPAHWSRASSPCSPFHPTVEARSSCRSSRVSIGSITNTRRDPTARTRTTTGAETAASSKSSRP